MPPAARKSGSQPFPAELALVPLKNCLVNLPARLVQVLHNSNTEVQTPVIELVFRQSPPPNPSGTPESKPVQKSVYVGWTGHESKAKLASVVGKDGLNRGGSGTTREQEIAVVEIDATFANLLGLTESQKVGVLLHPEPPLAHTINIEPLTSADWEIIELHANFLEIHLLSQIRALPNPTYTGSGGQPGHPLTLHMSPTSTANIVVTALTPPPAPSWPFAKIASNSEVIVAPKARMKAPADGKAESRSVQSGGGRSATSGKNRGSRNDSTGKKPIFLRGMDRSLAKQWFDSEEDSEKNEGLKVWVDWSLLTSSNLRGVTWVWVSIVRPTGLQAPMDPQQMAQQQQENVHLASKVVAQILPWEDSPDTRHAALSSALCTILDAKNSVGEMIRIETAPQQVSKSPTTPGRQAVKTLRIFPFAPVQDRQKDGFKFGGKTKTEREEAAQRLQLMFGRGPEGNKLLEGPLTDGMMLPPASQSDQETNWEGGILRFEPPPGPPLDKAKTTRGWLLGSERKLTLEVVAEVARPPAASKNWAVGEALPTVKPSIVGIDKLVTEVKSHIQHTSSILLTGGYGSGKSSLAQYIGLELREDSLFYTIYFACRTLAKEETRVSTIKETLSRVFGLAAWGARLGAYSLVILDDLDKICPVETELQVGNENNQSRHVSELVVSIVRQYCSLGSRVVLLATAQSKDSVNNVIIGGHVVREIVNLPAPDKETRRTILESIMHEDDHKRPPVINSSPEPAPRQHSAGERPLSWASSDSDSNMNFLDRMKEKAVDSNPTGFDLEPSLDVLDIAGQTDGYMPGDLRLLVSRARSEALIRNISESSQVSRSIELTAADFTAALKGFTPSSLRNVTLQHSNMTFSAIGGLESTRKTLLETLQYPTLYAPIFARCPLRLRSGLLLYGYPGCGKTLLASAVAGECGLNFISVKGPEILNKYIGASEKSVRDLFERAQAAKPCVLFFDEFDSIAPKRGHDSTGVTDRVVNQMLTQMDGAEGLSGVYVLAATSRPDLIDPALLRPGRLDKSLLCDMPSYEERLDILRTLSKDLRISGRVLREDSKKGKGQNLEEIARRTDGYSGADLQAVVYNAHLEAIHDSIGDRPHSPSKSRHPSDAKNSTAVLQARSIPEFSYFRYGEESQDETPLSAAGKAAERATLVAQLSAHKAALQRARAARHASVSQGSDEKNSPVDARKESQEPLIEWKHIEKSLSQARPSLSSEERRRLAGIYREFAVGRNGEMPSGQGGSEIGGRSSMW